MATKGQEPEKTFGQIGAEGFVQMTDIMERQRIRRQIADIEHQQEVARLKLETDLANARADLAEAKVGLIGSLANLYTAFHPGSPPESAESTSTSPAE